MRDVRAFTEGDLCDGVREVVARSKADVRFNQSDLCVRPCDNQRPRIGHDRVRVLRSNVHDVDRRR